MGRSSLAIGGIFALGSPTQALAFEDALKTSTKQLYHDGKRDFNAGLFEAAAQKFQRAQEAIPLPMLALWLARAQARSGDLVAAAATYASVQQLQPNELWLGEKQQQAQAEASRELESLRLRILSLVVKAEQKAASATTNSATHPKAASGSAGDVRRTVGWVGVSVGAAGLLLGSVTGILVKNRHDAMEGDCRVGLCDRRVVTAAQVNEYNQLRQISSVGLIAGGAFCVAGITLILTAPTQEAEHRLTVGILPNGAYVSGGF